MAKKRQPAPPPPLLTSERAGRLCRLVSLLQDGPQTRADVLRRLQLDMRGFYRDLQLLRTLGVVVNLEEGVYSLQGTPAAALARLPLPDPQLTVAEAQQLSKGKTAAHKKLAGFLTRLLPSE